MKKTKLNKKATSPMLTTIFLLIFALALGFVLVNLNDIMPEQDKVCEGMYAVKIVRVRNQPRICQEVSLDANESVLKVLLTNEAEDTNVDGLKLTFIGDSDDPVYILRDFETVIKPDGTISKKYYFPNFIGNLSQVKISLYRQIGNRLEHCSKYSLITNYIPVCDELF